MASTERGDEQAPATASDAAESPTFSPDLSGVTPDPRPVPVGAAAAAEAAAAAPALPVRRVRRVVVADPVPEPPPAEAVLAGERNGHGAEPVAAAEPAAPPRDGHEAATPGVVASGDGAPAGPALAAGADAGPAADSPPIVPDSAPPDEAPLPAPPGAPLPARPAVRPWVPAARERAGRRTVAAGTPLPQDNLGTLLPKDNSGTPLPEGIAPTVAAGAPLAQDNLGTPLPQRAARAGGPGQARWRRVGMVGAPQRDPDAILEAEVATAAAPAPRWRAAIGRSAVWRARGLVLGAAGLGLGLHGQQLVTVDHDILGGLRWYAAAILVMIVGWLGTYQDKSFLVSPFRRPATTETLPVRSSARPEPARKRRWRFAPWRAFATRYPLGAMVLRYALAFGALGLNLYSVSQLREHGYNSAIGGYGWVISLVLLLVAFLGHNPPAHRSADALVDDVEDQTDIRINRRLEIAIFLGLFVLGAALRLYRLGDWTTGMHGDEGEAGMDAINILEGNPVSPFLTGWFSQPNFYYWGIALTMKVFGTGLLGLRMFSTLAGTLMLIPFYPLVRRWFGVRTAIIATFLLAVSDVAIHFTKQEFSNITTPLFLVTGFFFFFRGLRDRKLINFVLAGYAHILSMYFYLGGRLTPILVIAFMAYLFVLMPLVRLPGVYGDFRQRLPELSRVRALGRAARFQVRGVLLYTNQIIVYTLACICFVSPWLAYFVDHTAEWNSRANEKLILNNPDRMVAQHGVSHTPLYIGVRLPTSTDILPLPVVFEQTPVSIRLLPLPWENPSHPNPNPLLQDGFWARAMWDQLTTTLSILTYRGDASSVYTFAQAPVAKPIEAVLIILGIAWAMWRWRDTRMALLSLWFWSTVIVGGVLTIDAPYMARLVGVIPTLAIFAALPLNKLAAEFVHVVGRIRRSLTLTRTSLAFSSIAIFALLVYLGRENYTDYFDVYLQQLPAPFTEVTGQAYFVQQTNAALAKEGRPPAKFYDLGAHLIYWGHGDNRFLNHGVEGLDMVNASNELPVVSNGENADKDAVFMVWGLNQQYLSVLQAYYPNAIVQPFYYPSADHGVPLVTSVRVPKEQLDAQRQLLATYTPATGPAIQRDEPNLGTGSQPLDGDLTFPLQARWTGNLVAPAFGRYRFRVDGPAGTRLLIDGSNVLTGTTGSDASIILARGPHDVELASTLADSSTHVKVQWAIGNQVMGPIPRPYLWNGPGKGLLGDIRPLTGDAFGPWPADKGNGTNPAILRRLDGFLGFRDAPSALSNGAAFMARWTGTLQIAQAGTYAFSSFSNGDSTLAVDGQTVVNNRQGTMDPHEANGQVALTAGPHAIEVRYSWQGNIGYLEVYWTPPNGQRVLLGPANLHADGGAWAPGTIPEPGNVNIQLGVAPPVVPADAVLDLPDDLVQPRGLAVDAQGRLYIADTGHHRVVVSSPEGKVLGTWGSQGSGDGQFQNPEDIAIGPDGLVYVLDSGIGRVEVFTPDGKFQRAFGQGTLCSPPGLTMGGDGLIYIADVCSGRVRAYSPDGTEKAGYTGGQDPGTRIDQPVDVVRGPDGMLYVADLRNRIVQIDPATDTIKQSWPMQIGTNLGASNLALFGKLLYVTDPDRNHIDMLNIATGEIDQDGRGGTASGEFGEPLGIATSADGKVYVVDSDHGRIEIFFKLVPSP